MTPVEFKDTGLPDIIELRNISQVYPTDDGEDVTIIKDLDLLIEDKPNQGQFVVILGHSGCGKCVAKGTWVRFQDGLRRIEDIVPRIQTGNPVKAEKLCVLIQDKKERLSHTYYGGTKKTVRITTKEGYELEGSCDHPVSTGSFEKPSWKKLKNIKVGDKVFFDLSQCSFKPSTVRICLPKATKKYTNVREKIKKYNQMGLNNLEISKLINMSPIQVGRVIRNLLKEYKFKVPLFLSKQMSYYLGLMAGDGSVKKKAFFTNDDDQLKEFFIKFTKEKFGVNCSITHKKGTTAISMIPKEIDRYSDWIIRVFGGERDSTSKDVPEIIRKASFSYQIEFLRGLFDTDGSASGGRIEIALNSKKLIDFVCNMLSALGIEYSMHKREKSYRVVSKKSHLVVNLFRLKRKIKRAHYDKKIKSQSKLCIVEKVEENENEIFDLTNPKSHSFIANGFLVHNSSLLRYIAGLQKPTTGEIKIHGKPRTRDTRVSMVFQQYSSLPWLSVLENVALGLKFANVAKKEREERAMDMIKLVGLEGHESKFAKYPSLSGGQLQRVAIARSLLANPEILLMDEPFGALDIHTRLKMQDLLCEIWLKLSLTVVFVTHDIPEAVYLGDEVWIMSANPGTIVDRMKVPFPLHRTKALKRTPNFTKMVYDIEDKLTQLDTKK